MSKYHGTIAIYNDKGDSVFERDLTADEMLDCFVEKETGVTITPANVHEIFESAKKKLRAQNKPKHGPGGGRPQKKGRKERVCGKCGEPGHNAKTCGRAKHVEKSLAAETAEWEADKAAKARKLLEGRVRRMVEGGLSVEEIKVGLKGDKLSEREMEEMIAYAQHNK